jgi:hypothetical protein
MLACVVIFAVSIWSRIVSKHKTTFAKIEEVSLIYCRLHDIVFPSKLAFFNAALLGDTSFTGVLSTPSHRHCKNKNKFWINYISWMTIMLSTRKTILFTIFLVIVILLFQYIVEKGTSIQPRN